VAPTFRACPEHSEWVGIFLVIELCKVEATDAEITVRRTFSRGDAVAGNPLARPRVIREPRKAL